MEVFAEIPDENRLILRLWLYRITVPNSFLISVISNALSKVSDIKVETIASDVTSVMNWQRFFVVFSSKEMLEGEEGAKQ